MIFFSMKAIFTFIFVTSLTVGYVFGQFKSKQPNAIFESDPNIGREMAFSFDFSFDTVTWAALDNAISINEGDTWDDPYYIVEIPFPFYFLGRQLERLQMGDYGGLFYGLTNTLDTVAIIAPFNTDLIDRGYIDSISLSPLSYKVIGEVGSRILMIEFLNAGSYDEYDILGTTNMFISFQMAFFESSNRIEFIYGPNMIDQPSIFYYNGVGSLVGLMDWILSDNDVIEIHTASGPASSPVLTDTLGSLDGTPNDGIRYIFTQKATEIENTWPSASSVSIVPNPVQDVTYLRGCMPHTQLQIRDAVGRLIYSGVVADATAFLPTAELMPGWYTVILKHAGDVQVIPFNKLH